MPGVRSVAVGFTVAVGARDEPDEIAGASHFLEHLLFKGSERLSAQEIAERVDAAGGDMNAFTSKESTTFEVRVLDEALDDALDILGEIMWTPALRPADVDTERNVILEEIALEGDEPADEVHDLLLTALFPEHPLGRRVLGLESSIEAMGRDDIATFHDRWYRPPGVIVAAAGCVDHDAFVEAVQRTAPATPWEPPERVAPAVAPNRLAILPSDTEQVHVAIGVRGVAHDDDDRHALAVADEVLGGGLSSRLFQEIRERRGLAYSVYSYRASFSDAGVWAVYAGVGEDVLVEALDVITSELARLRRDGITDDELRIAKSHHRGSLLLGLEDSGARMALLSRSQLVHGRVVSVDELLRDIDAVTVADVARVLERVLAGEPSIAIVGPVDERDLR